MLTCASVTNVWLNSITRITAYTGFFALFLVGTQACADTIYTNLGPGESWNGLDAYVSGSFFGTTFTATASGTLASIKIPVESNADFAYSDSIGLYEDSSGQPGTLLESWTVSLPPAGNIAPLTDLISLENPLLTAGTQYWLLIDAPTVGVIWELNNQGLNGGLWGGTSLNEIAQSAASNAMPAIQLNATAVPEPHSAMFIGFILLASAVFRSRRGAGTVRSHLFVK